MSSVPRLRPLGVGDLLDEAIRLYRNHFRLLVGIGAILLGPLWLALYLAQSFLLQASGLADFGTSGNLDAGMLGGFFGWYALFLAGWSILFGLAYAVVNLAITYAVSEVYLGRRPTIGSALSGGLSRVGKAILLGLVMAVAIILIMAVPIGGAVALRFWPIAVVGFPVAIYFGICWMLSFQTLLLERRGLWQAMGRSMALVRGSWWRVLGIAILISILASVLSMLAGLISGVIGAFIATGGSNGPLFTLLTTVRAVVDSAAQVLVAPVSLSCLVLLYYDLRVRKEGLDLELMAQQMGESPQPGPTTS